MDGRRKVTIVLLICVAIVTATSTRFLRRPEPRYQGIPIHVLLDQMARNTNTSQAYTAARELGTNCLPYVITALARNDSDSLKQYEKLRNALPAFLRRILPQPRPLLHEVFGANIFMSFGCNFIPQDIRLLQHRSRTVRRAAAFSLGSLQRSHCFKANDAIPPLIEMLDDPDPQIEWVAAYALDDFGSDATNAITSLTKITANTKNGDYLRAMAAVTLGKIGPAAITSAPTLKAATQSTTPYLRGQAAVALWRVTRDTESSLPALLAVMPSVSEQEKWDWIIALGEMGPRARAALPQLEKELTQDRENYILEYVHKSISQIQSEEP